MNAKANADHLLKVRAEQVEKEQAEKDKAKPEWIYLIYIVLRSFSNLFRSYKFLFYLKVTNYYFI